jgi:hypothetical protein
MGWHEQVIPAPGRHDSNRLGHVPSHVGWSAAPHGRRVGMVMVVVVLGVASVVLVVVGTTTN